MMSFTSFFMTYGLIVLELLCNLFSDHVAIKGFFRTKLDRSCDERAPLIDKKEEMVGTSRLSFLQYYAEFTIFNFYEFSCFESKIKVLWNVNP